MPKLTVDGKEIEFEQGMTLLQVCELANKEIPRFCYHERLQIAGNCRMCLVELEKAPKPVASCAQPAAEGMVVHTNSEMVKKAREGVMEFLLINHPLDCPICDQGGECDLQDQAVFYGKGGSRYKEKKRAVTDKYMGPLVKTFMTRCIHCTRCVRFLEDVAGVPELGAVNRGEDMQISTYVEQSLTSELSGNIIDLCPVGALTSKPYSFKCRSWELKKTESIDVMDAVGSNIRVDSRGTEVMRILPSLNEEINEEWISDKTRFAYDGLKYQRLDRPMIKNKIYEEVEWEEAFNKIKTELEKVSPEKVGAIAGELTDVETMTAMKEFLNDLGSTNHECRENNTNLHSTEPASFTFNTTIEKIEQADACLIIGCNPRHEATILNARIRKAVVENGMKVGVIGEDIELNYPHKFISNNPWSLKQIAEGSNPFCEALKNAKNPMIILGEKALRNEDAEAFITHSKAIAKKYKMVKDDWNGFNILNSVASRVGGLHLGFTSPNHTSIEQLFKESKVLFLLGADELNTKSIPKNTFVVYIGHHGDAGASRANVVLPAPAYTEKTATYVNLEGRVQQTLKAVQAPFQALEDWKIINKLAEVCGQSIKCSTLADVRKIMEKSSTIFKKYGEVNSYEPELKNIKMKDFTNDKFFDDKKNYYLTNSICRASKTMAECYKEAQNRKLKVA